MGPHGEPVRLHALRACALSSSLQGREACAATIAGGPAQLCAAPPCKPDRNKLSLVLWAVSAAKPGPGPHVSPGLSTESGGWWAFRAVLGKGRNLLLFTCFSTATCSAHFLLLWAALCTLFLTIVP